MQSSPHSSSKTTSSEANDDYPRLHRRLKMKELRLEAAARGENLATIPTNKADLLRFLVDGSIQLSRTEEWSALLRLKEKMEEEKPMLNDRNESTYKDILAREAAIRAARALDEQDRRRRKEAKAKEERKLMNMRMRSRQNEIEAQSKFHKLDFPRVHPCRMALSEDLSYHGSKPRRRNCSVCSQFVGSYACEQCDFDVCKVCFAKKNEPSLEAVATKKREEDEKSKLMAQWKAARRRRQAEEASERAKYEPKQFTKAVKVPSRASRDPRCYNGKGFTVWCSEGFRYEGRHAKNFDSTWKTKDLANLRARYLFFWDNCTGRPDELVNHEDGVDETEFGGLTTFRGVIFDQVWTVGVVPDVEFKQLQLSSEEPNDYYNEAHSGHAVDETLYLI